MLRARFLILMSTIITIFLSFACGEDQGQSKFNTNEEETPTSLAPETPFTSTPQAPETKNFTSPKSDRDLLNIIYSKESEIKLCDGQLDREISNQGSAVYPLNKGEYLIEILCFMGAYQGNYEYIFYKEEAGTLTIKPLIFQSFNPDSQGKFTSTSSRSLAGISNYNSEKKILNIYTKDRGLGDCGSTAQYQWENQDFSLVEYKAKPQCDGKAIEPENYPVIYSKNSNIANSNSSANLNQLSPQALINYLLNKKEELQLCSNGFQEDIARQASQVYNINNQDKLIELHCYLGAYQGATHWFLIVNNQLESLYFTDFRETENGQIQEIQENLITGTINYDQNQQTLSVFNKYAGHGGCGTTAQYQWQEISFELREFRANFDCDHSSAPENWQVIYSH